MTKNYKGTFPNVVVMGRKTYQSIPEHFRPLTNRINFVLTNNKELYNCTKKTTTFIVKKVYYMNFKTFNKLHKIHNFNIFVAGGGEIYNHFLDEKNGLLPDYLYITEVTKKLTKVPTIFMNHFSGDHYTLDGYSTLDTSVTVLYYRKNIQSSQEHKYLNFMRDILRNGNTRDDRTGTGTISVFGRSMRFDISKSIPLLTTKRVPFKMVLEELLWFCRGDTDSKILQEKGIHIWDGNTSREFLDGRGLTLYPEGVLGAGYGWQYRFSGARYHPDYADTSKLTPELRDNIGGFDQLNYVEHLLKTDPMSRRIMICIWNPIDFEKTALVPCHFCIMFYVKIDSGGDKILNAQFVMRSNDVLLGNPFNIASYATLVHILAKRCGMKPGELIYTGNDVHIYSNHLDAVTTQLSRETRPLPTISVSDNVIDNDWSMISVNDVKLIGYFPHPGIKAKMAI
jgi:thymidylate synthase/dihydrofolate reductase